MHIHFIAIGGSAMHNLAIALHKKGYRVTGSDDEIFEPSKSRLEKYGLLPAVQGWQPQLIEGRPDVIILGMHARKDNPELLKAQELGLKIYSYPEYLFEQTKTKTRVVVGGSHGKTTTTSMIMHVLKFCGVNFDYMVGATIDGFDTMVNLDNDTEIAVFEGDEYLSSPIDLRPKFHHYKPNIALLTGIAWDHINVFPTFEGYVDQFGIFASMIEPDGSLIYFEGDENLRAIANQLPANVDAIPYSTHQHFVEGTTTFLVNGAKKFPLHVFGDHNLQNISGAYLVCKKLGISDEQFYKAISAFTGSSRRLEVVAKNDQCTVFYDFAHSPSKLKATTMAVKKQFSDRKLVAVMELHTFSSLKREFLPQYHLSMECADVAYVYFDAHTIEHKKLEPISASDVEDAFGGTNCKVFTNSDLLFEQLRNTEWHNCNLLIMSSGNFSGKNIKEFAQALIK
ncbi:MAG TPA: Mur ligase family protein [Prolixibacteraceae bacterium]|nr:Mur ligase family protein [Prolixibacteraceae bacterium]